MLIWLWNDNDLIFLGKGICLVFHHSAILSWMKTFKWDSKLVLQIFWRFHVLEFKIEVGLFLQCIYFQYLKNWDWVLITECIQTRNLKVYWN